MSLRRLLNVTYALLCEGRDQAEIEQLDVLLEGDDGATAIKRQVRAGHELMGLMGGLQ